MRDLWLKEEIVAHIQGHYFGTLPSSVSSVSINSRQIEQGAIFFALKGLRFDGHAFLQQAVCAGATLLVVEKKQQSTAAHLGVAFIAVDDVLAALRQLALAARRRSHAKIIALTGSVGKTTTKEMLRLCFSAFGKVHASVASFNNHLGVPLSLARLPRDADFAIFEVGMNHAGEIAPLVKLIRPFLSLITCIAPVHLENFASLQEIAQEKAEIFQSVLVGGYVLLNYDDSFFDFLQGSALSRSLGVYSFGWKEGATYRLVVEDNAQSKNLTLVKGGQRWSLDLQLFGHHNLSNALAALACVDILQQDIGRAIKELIKFKSPKGRGQSYLLHLGQTEQQTAYLIDETYNANPISMAAALRNFAQIEHKKGPRLAVLGDMLELGAESEKYHLELLPLIAEAHLEKLILIGKNMKKLEKQAAHFTAVEWYAEYEEALAPLLRDLTAGAIVLLKSSNSIKTHWLVEQLLAKYQFSEIG